MRETFTTLTYPYSEGLLTADFLMNFTDNDYNGEKQIWESLKEVKPDEVVQTRMETDKRG